MDILIVDDSPTIRAITESSLTALNYTVTSVQDAANALSILNQYKIQLVILDWMMPGMNGIELAKAIRQRFTDRYIYIIMLTAKDKADDMVMGLESGIDDFMIKPIEKRELKARIKIGERIITLENQLRHNLDIVNQVQQEWTATTEAIPQLICLLDINGNIVQSNGTLSGWQISHPQDLIGRKLHNLLRRILPDFANQLRHQWEEAKQELEQGLNYRFDGTDQYSNSHFHVHFEPIGNIIESEKSFAAVSIHDITKQKQLEHELIIAKQQVEEEHNKSERLLLNILPPRIVERLKHNETTIAESFDNISVLFADLVGFTALSRTISPHKLVALLNTIFTRFDQLTSYHQLEKIKTIGDSYLVVGGLSIDNPDHVNSILSIGFDMNHIITEVNSIWNYELSIRIGIHCGPVIAGVIGKNKFIYDLWGDTVNIASRMESHGIKGHIHVTEDIVQQSNNHDFDFQSRGDISVKGIGDIHTYLVKNKKGRKSTLI